MKIRDFLKGVWIFLLAIPLAAQSGKVRIYVLNMKGGPSIDVIDPATNRIVRKIDGIPGAAGAVFSADGTRAYITSESGDTVYLLDTVSGKVLNKLVLHEGSANLPALTENGRLLFVCVNGVRNARGLMQSGVSGGVDIIDTESFRIIKSVREKAGMHDCYATPDGKYVIAGTIGGKFLEVLDARTGNRLWRVDMGDGVTTIAQELGPDGATRRLFTPLAGYRGFGVVDFTTHKAVGRIPLPARPSGVLMPPNLARRDKIPTHGDMVSPDGKTLWVASRGSNAVFVYSLPAIKLLKIIDMPRVKGLQAPRNGGDPSWIAFTPDGKTVYVSNSAADSVSVIDAKAMKEVAVIPVGRQPDHVFALAPSAPIGSSIQNRKTQARK